MARVRGWTEESVPPARTPTHECTRTFICLSMITSPPLNTMFLIIMFFPLHHINHSSLVLPQIPRCAELPARRAPLSFHTCPLAPVCLSASGCFLNRCRDSSCSSPGSCGWAGWCWVNTEISDWHSRLIFSWSGCRSVAAASSRSLAFSGEKHSLRPPLP